MSACTGRPDEARAPVAARAASRLPEGIVLATPAVTAYLGPARGQGAMPGVRPTRMGAELAAAGLDPANLPPLEALPQGTKQRVMRTFTEALGIPCLGCHAEDDFSADTRRKRVAKRMYGQIVRVLATRNGEPIYCDSCHDGALFNLDRRDPRVTAAYMCEALTDGLRRVDGRPHECTTCHGDPPDFHILATWKARPAPDVMTAEVHAPLTSTVEEPDLPKPGPRVPSSCGAFSAACPLDRFMRYSVAPAAVAEDGAELALVLRTVGAWRVDDRWTSIADRGAAAAVRGDFGAVRGTCGECHAAYKEVWRKTDRTRGPRPDAHPK
jgi:hypothetical protein